MCTGMLQPVFLSWVTSDLRGILRTSCSSVRPLSQDQKKLGQTMGASVKPLTWIYLDRVWIDVGHYDVHVCMISPSSFWRHTILPNTQPLLLLKWWMCPVLCCLVHVVRKTAVWLESRSEVDRPAIALLLNFFCWTANSRTQQSNFPLFDLLSNLHTRDQPSESSQTMN